VLRVQCLEASAKSSISASYTQGSIRTCPRALNSDGYFDAPAPVTDTQHNSGDKKEMVYRESLSSLFILESLEETLRSIVRSPISTTSPPTISGLT